MFHRAEGLQHPRVITKLPPEGEPPVKECYAKLDWTNSPLGPVEAWPISLRVAWELILETVQPAIIYWGPQSCILFNQACRNDIYGSQPIHTLGKPGKEVWPEIWPTLQPVIDDVRATGRAYRLDNGQAFLNRSGYVEETFFSWSCSPIYQEDGSVGGVFIPLIETTDQVLSERRLRTLGELSTRTSNASSAQEACRVSMEALQTSKAILFGSLYLLSKGKIELVSTTFKDSSPPSWLRLPTNISLSEESMFESQLDEKIAKAFKYGQADQLRCEVTEEGAKEVQVLIFPIPSSNKPGDVSAVFVTAPSPNRALDKNYQKFFDLVCHQIASAVGTAKALEAERKRAEMLAELDRAKTAFFSNISHEFRTPLTLMAGPLEDMLSSGELSPQHEKNLQMVLRNTQRLRKLVNNLMDFSAIDEGRNTARYEPTDIAQLTRDLASSFEFTATRLGVRLIVDCDLPDHGDIYVDRNMWEKIVLNLLSNAFKFTWEGHVHVTIRRVPGGAELSLTDTGIGIEEDHLPCLFERFFRAQNQNKTISQGIENKDTDDENKKEQRGRSYEGTGIGLPLTRELVRLHGGEITATSAVGKGSTFKVFIPAGYEHLPSERVKRRRSLHSPSQSQFPAQYADEALGWVAERNATKEERSQDTEEQGALSSNLSLTPRSSSGMGDKGLIEQRRRRVLVVDDNLDMLRYISSLLEPFADVVTASNGKIALDIATSAEGKKLDLVLSDVMMPVMDGFAFLRALRQNVDAAHLPVIFLSARAGQEASSEGLEKGADDYITKPFSGKELIAKVNATINLSQLRRQIVESEKANMRRTHFITAILQRIRSGLSSSYQVVSDVLLDVCQEMKANRVVLCELKEMTNPRENEENLRDSEMEYQCTVTFEESGREEKEKETEDPGLLGQSWTVLGGAGALQPEGLEDRAELIAACSSRFVEPSEHCLTASIWVNEKIWGFLHCSRQSAWNSEEETLLNQIGEHIGMGIAQLRMIEQHIQQRIALDSVVAANRTKNMIIANTSHELRTPLNAIVGLAELLRDTKLTREQEDMVGTILTASESLLRLVNDILDFSKMEADKLVLHDEDFDIHDFMSNVLDMFSELAGNKGIEMANIVDLPPWLPTVIRTDSGRLTQVLVNLINNAIKFMVEGQVVVKLSYINCDEHNNHTNDGTDNDGHITGRQEEEKPEKLEREFYLKFEVIDTGIGISQEGLQRIFQPFSQVDESSTRPHGGTGLGLAISKLLVNLASGDIGVESELGKGSKFWFTWLCYLPNEPAHHSPAIPNVGTIPPRGKRGSLTDGLPPVSLLRQHRVLIVDRSEHTLQSISLYLTGAECHSAQNLLDGIDVIKRDRESGRPFTVVMFDTTFPIREDLISTARQVQQLSPATRLVLLTLPDHNHRIQAQKIAEEVPIDSPLFLRKPIRKSSLVSCLRVTLPPIDETEEYQPQQAQQPQAQQPQQPQLQDDPLAERPVEPSSVEKDCQEKKPNSETPGVPKGQEKATERGEDETTEKGKERGNDNEEKKSKKRTRLLVVEDNPVNRKVVLAQLKKLGYTDVDIAVNGKEGLDMVKSQANEEDKYALVFMDISMPVMDGLEATKQIRSLGLNEEDEEEKEEGDENKKEERGETTIHRGAINDKHAEDKRVYQEIAKERRRRKEGKEQDGGGGIGSLPIIALTASVLPQEREQCLECGMSDVLTKPLRSSELAAMLEKWIGSPNQKK